ncbi:ral guanine nucleotide dissociation stimulator-like 2 isoform X2 [Tiliqua scincoides]|uniref:ral guanine nucleotide dissociation stimulator-like 2 isoform X2 n=1 Tax=Tiliqua scincoides TaxID=71010 RepID=UPI0034626217
MKVFLRLGGCLEPGGPAEGGLLTRTRWYCLPSKAPVTLREEAGEGVIFTVSSRAPGGGRGSCCEEEAASSTPGQARALKAGLLPQLVWHLLEAPALGDACYVPAFLATYRTFATTPVVLQLLLDRLQTLAGPGSDVTPDTAELQRALGSLLCSWLEGHPKDFAELEPGLQEALLLRLRWALGDGSGPEKSLCAAARGTAPAAKEEPEEGILDDGDPDPHYILGLQAEEVAAHLTWQDAELFLHLAPHECLGSLWSQRVKKGHEGACPTVRATVAQFNRVANAVVASCLGDTGLRAAQRARLLEKWIRVAEECLCLRNFSSLYAVVSALQSSSLHRLKRTWEETARDSLRCYEELSSVCSEEDNYSQSRRLLFQEAGADSTQRRHQQRMSEQRLTGVVPYLGMFLKDLVMLDTAMRDQLQNGYINFEKHRKEFEILTQLRHLQASCRNYTLKPNLVLQRWLQHLPRLSEAHSYQLSCAIEPPGEGTTPARPVKPTLVITRCADLLCSVGRSPIVSWDKPSPSQAPPDLLLPPPLAQPVKWPSVSALDTAQEIPAPEGLAPPRGFVRGHRRSASCGTAYPRAPASGGASPSDCRIVRVRLELQDGAFYKSILVTSQDKAPAVVAKVLEKHNQDLSLAPSYELVQLLPEGQELVFPPMANIFYAMNSSSLDFMLRPRGLQKKPPPSPSRLPSPRGREICATCPKIKATGRKIAKVLF